MDSENESQGPILFAAELRPRRSLSPLGFGLLMAGISTASFAAGLGFWLLGAWPVVGFLGADVALVYIAFRVSFWRARETETLRLTGDALLVRRVGPNGAEMEWRFHPYWVRLADDVTTRSLVLTSHGQSVGLGRFLGTAERRDLEQALSAALARLRVSPI
jgi:uncharacterized membrane protein